MAVQRGSFETALYAVHLAASRLPFHGKSMKNVLGYKMNEREQHLSLSLSLSFLFWYSKHRYSKSVFLFSVPARRDVKSWTADYNQRVQQSYISRWVNEFDFLFETLQRLEFNHCRNFIFVVDNVVSGVKDFQENSLIIFLKTHRKEWIISGRYKKKKYRNIYTLVKITWDVEK